METIWDPIADFVRNLLRPDSRRLQPVVVPTDSEEQRRRRRARRSR